MYKKQFQALICCHSNQNVFGERFPTTNLRISGSFVFTTVQAPNFVFFTGIGLEFIHLSRLWEFLIFLVRKRCCRLANPTYHTVMIDATRPFNASKSHPMERHTDGFGL